MIRLGGRNGPLEFPPTRLCVVPTGNDATDPC